MIVAVLKIIFWVIVAILGLTMIFLIGRIIKEHKRVGCQTTGSTPQQGAATTNPSPTPSTPKKKRPLLLRWKFWLWTALIIGILCLTQWRWGFPLLTIDRVVNSLGQAFWYGPVRDMRERQERIESQRAAKGDSYDARGEQRYGYIVPFRHDGTPYLLPSGKVDPPTEVEIHRWTAESIMLRIPATATKGSFTYVWSGGRWGNCDYNPTPGKPEKSGSSIWRPIEMGTGATNPPPLSIKAEQWTTIKAQTRQRAQGYNRRSQEVALLGAFFFTTASGEEKIKLDGGNTTVYVLVEAVR